jgi:hypothetical protein
MQENVWNMEIIMGVVIRTAEGLPGIVASNTEEMFEVQGWIKTRIK